MIEQLRKTGGIFLDLDDFSMYIDPGPGALVNSLKHEINLKDLDAVLVSHPHLDHYNDAEVLIEAMTRGTKVKRGKLIGNESVFRGNKKSPEPVISKYHREVVDEVIKMKEGDEAKIGSYTIKSTENQHRDEKPISFKIIPEKEGKSIGFITDSDYLEKFAEFFENVDRLVLNVMRPKEKEWEGHLNTEDALKIINEIEPKIAILTHFGRSMIYSSLKKQKKWLEENLEVDTDIIFAQDFQEIDFEGEKESLSEFIDDS